MNCVAVEWVMDGSSAQDGSPPRKGWGGDRKISERGGTLRGHPISASTDQ